MERASITAAQSHQIAKLLLAHMVRRIQEGNYPIGAMIQLRASGDGLVAVCVTPEMSMEDVAELMEWRESPSVQAPFPVEFFAGNGVILPGDVETGLGPVL